MTEYEQDLFAKLLTAIEEQNTILVSIFGELDAIRTWYGEDRNAGHIVEIPGRATF